MLATTERQEHEPPSAPAAIAEELAALIAHAEEPSRLSKRDGRLLPLVPPSERVDASPELLRRSGALLGGAWEVAALVTSVRRACAGCTTTTAKRAVAAWARSLVYLEAGAHAQALRDARLAMACCATRPGADISRSEPQAPGTEPDHVRLAERCAWLPAVLAAASAHLAQGQPVHAAELSLLALARAEATAEQVRAADAVAQRALPRLPGDARSAMWAASRAHCQSTASASFASQAAALTAWASERRRSKLPPILQPPTEKWQHYKQWMRERLHAALGLPAPDPPHGAGGAQELLLAGEGVSAAALPEPVVRKMVEGLGADDLDLLLKHPLATAAQVVELLGVLRWGGEEALGAHKIAPPAWEEVQLLTGSGCQGLPLGWNSGPTALPDLLLARPAEQLTAAPGPEEGAAPPLALAAAAHAERLRLLGEGGQGALALVGAAPERQALSPTQRLDRLRHAAALVSSEDGGVRVDLAAAALVLGGAPGPESSTAPLEPRATRLDAGLAVTATRRDLLLAVARWCGVSS